MIKKSLVGLGTAFILGMSSWVQAAAADAGPKGSMDAKESRAASAFIAQLLGSIEKASIDFEMTGSIDSKNGFNTDMMRGTGIMKFDSDWTFPTSTAGKDGESSSDEIDKVMPMIRVDAKDLISSLTVDRQTNVTDIFLDFYKGYDTSKKQWLGRPLTITASNQFNKELMRIKFFWVHLKLIQPQDITKPTVVKGTCESSKDVLDIISGASHSISVQCEFEGTYSKDDYNIKFKYLNEPTKFPAATAAGVKP